MIKIIHDLQFRLSMYLPSWPDFSPHSWPLYGHMLANMRHDYLTALNHWHPNRPFLIILLPFLLWGAMSWGKRQFTIRHSTLAPQTKLLGLSGWRSKRSVLLSLGYVWLGLSVTNIDVAMMGPTVEEAKTVHQIRARRICIEKDSSGSTQTELKNGIKEVADQDAEKKNDPSAVKVDNGGAEKFTVQQKQAVRPKVPTTRSDWETEVARYLIEQRMTMDPLNTDRFCLIRFDMDTYMVAPLSNDKIAMLLRVDHLNENVGGGTNFGGPDGNVTDIGPLQFAYDYFTHESESNPDFTNVDVMLTDGYDAIDPQRRAELEDLFLQANIDFYIIGLGDGWSDPNKPLDLEKFAQELNKKNPKSGIVFLASNPGEIQKAMDKINELEKNEELVEMLPRYREVDYAFIIVAGGCYFLFLVFASLARRNP